MGRQNVCIFGFFFEHQIPERNIYFLEHLWDKKKKQEIKGNFRSIIKI